MKKLLCMCLLVLLCLSGTAQGQPALNEPVYLMVQGQLMEQLQVLHSGPRTCTHPSFSFEKQEAPDELLCRHCQRMLEAQRLFATESDI